MLIIVTLDIDSVRILVKEQFSLFDLVHLVVTNNASVIV